MFHVTNYVTDLSDIGIEGLRYKFWSKLNSGSCGFSVTPILHDIHDFYPK
jgi:hypothetical protein